MLLMKSCPKCSKGDLTLERHGDNRLPDLACLQCSYVVNPQERRTLLAPLRRGGPRYRPAGRRRRRWPGVPQAPLRRGEPRVRRVG